jgi:hypothetical protein
MAKTIRFTKVAGEVLFRKILLTHIENELATLSNGKYLISVTRDVERRSLSQNALMWLWFSCIEQETGTDKNDVHDYYCIRFLNRRTTINGREEMIVGGTSKLDTAQFADFLNKVQADAASEFGIRLPNPEDAYFESFRQEYERYVNY